MNEGIARGRHAEQGPEAEAVITHVWQRRDRGTEELPGLPEVSELLGS